MRMRGVGLSLAIVLAAAAAAAQTSDKKGEQQPKPAEADEIDALLEDPVKHREAILAWQRKQIEETNAKLGLKCVVLESDHYILSSTMSPAVAKQIASGCEDLYNKMCKTFAVKKGDVLWAGKCVVHVFDKQEEFVAFAVQVDEWAEQSARNVVGYFCHEGRLAHIAIPRLPEGEKDFEATLIHEGAHVFLQLFNEDVPISPWIHEGVAQYFENKCFPNELNWQTLRNLVRAGRRLSFSSLRSCESFGDLGPNDMELYYAYAWSAVDFMIRANPKKFVKFIHALKAGKSEEEAIREAFGKNMDEFEKAWLAYARKSF